MPSYTWKCENCEHEFTKFLWVSQYKAEQECPTCRSGKTHRIYTELNFEGQEENWPIRSVALGCPENEREFYTEHYRKMGVPTEFDER